MEAQGWAAGAQGEQSPTPGASLRVDERPGPLPEAKAFGPEVLGVATCRERGGGVTSGRWHEGSSPEAEQGLPCLQCPPEQLRGHHLPSHPRSHTSTPSIQGNWRGAVPGDPPAPPHRGGDVAHTFAVDLPIFVCQGGGLQALATLGAAEAGLVPGLWDRRGTQSGGNGDETAKLWYHVGSLWRLCF